MQLKLGRIAQRIALTVGMIGIPLMASAQSPCAALPSHEALKAALTNVAVDEIFGDNAGVSAVLPDLEFLHMWGTIVNRDGEVCAVAFTGEDRGDQWPGSRVISAQKANTANAFSLPGFALSTANLYSAVQPGGSLFGLQESNPVDVEVAYGGNAMNNGRHNDHMVGGKVGGVNVFGGGVPLYNDEGTLVGALGVSGDTSCTDHTIAWRTRQVLGLNNVPNGVNNLNVPGDDNIIYDITDDAGGNPESASGFGHPACGFGEQVP